MKKMSLSLLLLTTVSAQASDRPIFSCDYEGNIHGFSLGVRVPLGVNVYDDYYNYPFVYRAPTQFDAPTLQERREGQAMTIETQTANNNTSGTKVEKEESEIPSSNENKGPRSRKKITF